MKPIYSVIVPLYNEELVISESYRRLTQVLSALNESYELVFVNDGSRDKTEEMVLEICSKDENVKFINFSRNFGHQSAITAGMDFARGSAIVIIDADLQDPPELIPDMINLWKQGYEVVYGKRNKRRGETIFKKLTAKMYYRFLKNMTSVDIPVDTGDFRLIDRKVCDAMKSLTEKNRYVRGLISWVGFKQVAIMYDRDERFAGDTKYPLKKMVKFAIDGITAFSYKPLKLATFLGFFISFASFIFLLFIMWQKLFTNKAVDGWTSTVVIILFTQGIVLTILGLMGEYIGRIFDEIKNRPIYIVKEAVGFNGEKDEITKENN